MNKGQKSSSRSARRRRPIANEQVSSSDGPFNACTSSLLPLFCVGAKSTTATRSLDLGIIHVMCPAEACLLDGHVVKAREISHIHKGYEATQKFQVICRENGNLLYNQRRRFTRNLSSLTVVGPPGHGTSDAELAACSVCKSGGV